MLKSILKICNWETKCYKLLRWITPTSTKKKTIEREKVSSHRNQDVVIWKSSVLAVFILTYINLEVPWNIRYGAHADSMPAKVKPFWCAAMCNTCWNVNKRRAFESSSKLQLWRFFLQESVVWFYPPPHACTYTHAHTHTHTTVFLPPIL